MSSNTALMSDYTVDKKEPVQSELPIYRLNNEAEELTVGGEAPAKRGCFWKRFGRDGRCCRRSGVDGEERRQKRRSCAKKFFKAVMFSILFFSFAGFFIAKQKMHCMIKSHPVTCVPIEEGADASLTLALASERTHIGLHHSLTGGDIHITHSDAVDAGHVAFMFDTPIVQYTDEEETPEYFVCSIAGPKFVGVGIHAKDRDTPKVKATSTSVTLSSSEAGHSRSMTFMTRKPKFGHKLMRKLFRKQIRKAIRQAVKAAKAAQWEKIEHADAE